MDDKQINISTISFKTKLSKIDSWTILKIPKNISAKLPSRGIVMVKGTINGARFQTVLEPDGKGSHWFTVSPPLLKAARLKVGSTAALEVEPTQEWPEPKVPADLKKALNLSPQARRTWMDITPMARWDWIRWIRSTKNPLTRKLRIEKTFSKFKSGKRRPCCFNRTECTVPEVSNRGVLLER